MITTKVYALGQDPYWLAALQKVDIETVVVKTIQCPGDLISCLGDLPKAEKNALILLDASGQTDIEDLVQTLRNQNWRYVIVVADDPSAKESIKVLRNNQGYDYWNKTYYLPAISNKITRFLKGVEWTNNSEKQQKFIQNPDIDKQRKKM